MNLAFMDADFGIIKYIKYINLQWVRRYYEPGEFSVQLPASEYVGDCAYVYTKDRPEVGIIQKREYTDGYDGSVMQLSGYFYEYKLNDKITFPRFSKTGNIEAVARLIVDTYKADIPLLRLGQENIPLLGRGITKQSTGKGLATVLYRMLQTQELSFRCAYDYRQNTMNFEVWEGKDRTQDQSVNSFVTFSEAFRNLQNEVVTIDSSNFKNYAVVVGNGPYEEGSQIEVEVDLRDDASAYKQILYVDRTDALFNSDEQTLDDYKAELFQAGVEALAGYSDITNVKFDTVDRGLSYLKDYDLGDRCDIVLDSIHESYVARITEVAEVFKSGQHSVTLQFGDKVPTIYAKSRR